MPYIELHASSAFSFLRAASLPEELAERCAQLGMAAMALCDRDGVYGMPRFVAAAKAQGIRPIVGCEITMEDGSILPVLVENRTGYQNLCRLLTQAHLRAEKGKSAARWEEIAEFAEGLMAIASPLSRDGRLGEPSLPAAGAAKLARAACGRAASQKPPLTALHQLLHIFSPNHLYIELQRHHIRGENRPIRALIDLAKHHRLPLLATNGVRHATPRGHEALDVFTCLRHHIHLDAAGRLLTQNAERHLKSPHEMAALFADIPEAVANTERLADRLTFSRRPRHPE